MSRDLLKPIRAEIRRTRKGMGPFRATVEVDRGFLRKAKLGRKVVSAVMLDAGEYWHQKYLPKHFIRGARGKYGFRQRSKKYNRLKASKHGHEKPLVFTGAMERDLTRSATFIPRTRRVEVKMYSRTLNLAPSMPKTRQSEAVTIRARGGGVRLYPNIPKEVRTVSQNEATELSQIIAKKLERAMNKRGR